MSANELIDLTSVPSEVSEKLMALHRDYDDDQQVRYLRRKLYLQQKKLSEPFFQGYLEESCSKLLDDVENFVNKILDKDNAMFPDAQSNLIHPAQIIMGIQSSDHSPTIDLIEKILISLDYKIHIARLNTGFCKKIDVINLVGELKSKSNVLVIVEQCETFGKPILEVLVRNLYNLLQSSGTKTVIVLFCISGSWMDMNQVLIDHAMIMERIATIVKDSIDKQSQLPARLLDVSDIRFRLGPLTAMKLDESFFYNNATISHLKYFYQYAMFKHFQKSESLLLLDRPTIIKLLTEHKSFKVTIRNLKSLRYSKASDQINWDDPSVVADFCLEKLNVCLRYHKILWEQLGCYLELISDETRTAFPSSTIEIYTELIEHDNLASSVEFIEAIGRIKFYPIERILKRIERCLSNQNRETKKLKLDNCLFATLSTYKTKLKNNIDSKEILNQLVSKLRLHSQQLRSPLTLPLHEAVYYENSNIIQEILVPSRYKMSMILSDESTYIGLLYSIITASTEQISTSDLFNDFVQNVRNSKQKNFEKKDEGLLKAVFIDLIESFEQNGLIKRDTKKGSLKRCVWF